MHDSNLKSPHSLGTLGLFFTPLVLAGERFCGRIRGTDGLKRSQSSARWDRSAQMLRDKHSILSVSQWREERGSGIKPLFGCGLFSDSQPLLDLASQFSSPYLPDVSGALSGFMDSTAFENLPSKSLLNPRTLQWESSGSDPILSMNLNGRCQFLVPRILIHKFWNSLDLMRLT